MALPNADILKHSLPQLYQALLTASCLSCPSDPIQYLERWLLAFQGHRNLQNINWHTFADAERHIAITSLTSSTIFMEPDDPLLPVWGFEKAYSCYRRNLTNSCFRGWKRFTAKRKSDAMELNVKMDSAVKHHEKKSQRVAFSKWLRWLKYRKEAQAAATERRRERRKEYFEKLDMGSKEHPIGEGWDRLSMLPSKLSLKIFHYLELRDWLTCGEVCCTWRAIIRSGSLWSWINFSVEKDRITDDTVKQILQNYRPFVSHINMRGCTSLKWSSLTYISECRNLQDLNMSECSNVTDTMVQSIVEGCPSLIYLNLSCTLVTDRSLRELSRSSLNLQYLSLAYCYRFTDKGFQYLTTGKGCRSLIHLNLSGCTQLTLNGFRYISAGCPALRDIVINDMPTLSDSCVMVGKQFFRFQATYEQQALIAKCRTLSAVSLLDTPHLSDIAVKAIAEVAKLNTFSTEGNDHLTDVSWKALCRSSPGLRRLHAADCPRMTNASLKSMAKLKNLQYLDISHCRKVGDTGMQYLTEGSSATKLRELNVSHCSHIHDISVMRIAQRLCKLNHLNLSYCESLTDSGLEWLSGSSISSLDISGCNIQDQGLGAVEGIHLKNVVLAECVYITDIGIKKFCKRMTDLEHVDVSHCVTLSDEAIKAISFYCSGLVTLKMSGCPKMTDMAVQYLTGSARYLRELDVSGCVLLTDRTVRHVERSCPPLSSITMAYCSNISNKLATLRLQPHVQHWEHSTDDPPYWFGYNMGQTLQPIREASKTDDTWEEVEPALGDDKSRN